MKPLKHQFCTFKLIKKTELNLKVTPFYNFKIVHPFQEKDILFQK